MSTDVTQAYIQAKHDDAVITGGRELGNEGSSATIFRRESQVQPKALQLGTT